MRLRSALWPSRPHRSALPATLVLALLAAGVLARCNSGAGTSAAGAPSASASAGLAVPSGSGGARRGAVRTPTERIAAGATHYAKYCALCHAADGTGYAADNAPSLVSETFLTSVTDAYFYRTIRNGRPGTAMGAYAHSRGGPMTDEEVGDLVQYLRSKGPPQVALPTGAKGDTGRGQVVYDEHCTRCHGTVAQRGDAPQLSNPEFLQSATDSFVRYTVAKGRQGTKMAPFDDKLSATQIDDVVALVRSWAPALPQPQVVSAVPQGDKVVPNDLPVVINPAGAAPNFTLREGRFVSVEQVAEALVQKKKLVVIDARSPAEWLQVRIPGSIPAPYHELARLDRVPNDDTWVVAYCACPHHASGMVVDELRRRGHANAVILDEGILVWKQRGYPVEGESAAAAASGSPSARAVGSTRPGVPGRPAPPVSPPRNTVVFGPPPPPPTSLPPLSMPLPLPP